MKPTQRNADRSKLTAGRSTTAALLRSKVGPENAVVDVATTLHGVRLRVAH